MSSRKETHPHCGPPSSRDPHPQEDPQTVEAIPTGKAEDTDLFHVVPIRSAVPPALRSLGRKQGWAGPRWNRCALHSIPVLL